MPRFIWMRSPLHCWCDDYTEEHKRSHECERGTQECVRYVAKREVNHGEFEPAYAPQLC
jgi:hypothetical protein